MTVKQTAELSYQDMEAEEVPVQVAMVYKNNFNEVSYLSNEQELVGGANNLLVVLLLSMLALVTISRRPS